MSPLLLGHVLAALLVLGIAGYALSVSRDAFSQQAQTLAVNRATELRQHVEANLQRIDLAMRHVVLTNLRQTDAPEGRRSVINASLADHMALVPEVLNLRQTDAAGVVRFHGVPARGADAEVLSRDPLFQQARAHPTTTLLIGEPHLDPATGRWRLALARRVEDREGGFGGIVIGELDLAHFDQMIGRIPLGRRDSLSLRSTGLTLLIRRTGGDSPVQSIGSNHIAAPFAQALKASPEAGVFTAYTVFDGVERIAAYSTITPFPLMVIAGISRDEVMAPWRRLAWRIGGLAVLAALCVVLSASVTWRSWQLQLDSLRRIDEASRLTRVLLAAAADGVHVLDRDGRLVELSDSFAQMLGWPREDLLGRHASTWNATGSTEELTARIRGLHIGERQSFETRHRRADGSTIDVEISCVALALDGRELLYCASRDITRRRELEAEQTAMLDNEVVGILKLREHEVVWANRAVYRMFGVPDDAMLNTLAPLLIPAELDLAARLEARHADLAAGRPVRAQLSMRRQDGSQIWVDLNGTRLSADARETLWVLADITSLKRNQEEIEHLAMHDALTGLPNRRLLEDRLQQGMALSRRDGQRLAVCYIDLDGFKNVNDALGHAAGDRLLKDAAQRIQDCVREHDTVCRMGGDEFVMLLPLLELDDEAESAAQRVLRALQRPFELGGAQAVRITASAGLALYPADAEEGELLLHQADAALYQAKAAGRNRFARWRPPAPVPQPPAPS